MRKALLFSIIIAFFTILPHSIASLCDNVYAANAPREILKLSPFIFTISLSPHTTNDYSLTVENLQDTAIPIKVSTEDFVITDDEGAYAFGSNTENSLTSWIAIPQKEMILDPHQKTTIDFTVTTPDTISFGGYHGMIFIEPILPKTSQYASFLSTKIGAPVIASIGTPPGNITPIRIIRADWPRFISSTKDLQIDLTLQNNSVFHTTAKPILSLKPLWGDTHKMFLDEKLIFPGKTRSWNDQLPHNVYIRPNIYRSTLTIPTGNGNAVFENHILILAPLGFTVALVLLLLGTLLIYLQKKHTIHIDRFIKVLLDPFGMND